MKLNALLKHAREEAEVTQQELGDHLGYPSGHQYVSNWERNVCPPPWARMKEITKYLKIDQQEAYQAFIQDCNAHWIKFMGRVE